MKPWVASAFRRKDVAAGEFAQHSSAARILPAEAGSHTEKLFTDCEAGSHAMVFRQF